MRKKTCTDFRTYMRRKNIYRKQLAEHTKQSKLRDIVDCHKCMRWHCNSSTLGPESEELFGVGGE
jgi:hypothetical protein